MKSNILTLIEDNFSLYCFMNKKFNTSLLGCSSHLFQLAVKNILAGETSRVFQVQKLTKKLRTPLLSVKLRERTHLKPKRHNDKRWSPAYQFLIHYVELRVHVLNRTASKIDELLLSTTAKCKVHVFIKKQIAKGLRWGVNKVTTARCKFSHYGHLIWYCTCKLSKLIRLTVSFCQRYTTSALLVWTVKNLSVSWNFLSFLNIYKLSWLLLSKDAGSKVTVKKSSIIERAAKKLKISEEQQQFSDLDTRFNLHASDKCKRFFLYGILLLLADAKRCWQVLLSHSCFSV